MLPTKTPAKFQSNWKILYTDLSPLKDLILREDILCDIESVTKRLLLLTQPYTEHVCK